MVYTTVTENLQAFGTVDTLKAHSCRCPLHYATVQTQKYFAFSFSVPARLDPRCLHYLKYFLCLAKVFLSKSKWTFNHAKNPGWATVSQLPKTVRSHSYPANAAKLFNYGGQDFFASKAEIRGTATARSSLDEDQPGLAYCISKPPEGFGRQGFNTFCFLIFQIPPFSRS